MTTTDEFINKRDCRSVITFQIACLSEASIRKQQSITCVNKQERSNINLSLLVVVTWIMTIKLSMWNAYVLESVLKTEKAHLAGKFNRKGIRVSSTKKLAAMTRWSYGRFPLYFVCVLSRKIMSMYFISLASVRLL